jgi:farnesyl-diphosphate farnesyltransferase
MKLRSEQMDLRQTALEMLKLTSRTFYIPISSLPPGLQEAVASAYLCMRAIDQIEDHPDLDNSVKAKLLRTVSMTLQESVDGSTLENSFFAGLNGDYGLLEEVTLRIGEWAALAPTSIAPRVWDATAAMADRMAYWAERNWQVNTEADLDRYTFGVASAVGLLLSDLWAWYDGTQTNRIHAIGFGRGLQAVNILRNNAEDRTRGIDFFPDGWTIDQMQVYARRNMKLADAYTDSLPPGPAFNFCEINRTLAYATLNALAEGQEKLTRTQVMALIAQVTAGGR